MDLVCACHKPWNRKRADERAQVLGHLLALAAVCPFVGSLSDLIGRRYVALTGAAFLVVGNVVSSTAKTMNIFIGKLTAHGI